MVLCGLELVVCGDDLVGFFVGQFWEVGQGEYVFGIGFGGRQLYGIECVGMVWLVVVVQWIVDFGLYVGCLQVVVQGIVIIGVYYVQVGYVVFVYWCCYLDVWVVDVSGIVVGDVVVVCILCIQVWQYCVQYCCLDFVQLVVVVIVQVVGVFG